MRKKFQLMSCSRWLLFAGTLWLPVGLLAQSSLVPTDASKPADTVRRGMGVFGNVLGIHGADTLAVQGDLVLMEAEVVGEGTLSLCGSQPQRIIAQKSIVQNLHMANPTKVIVQGDLVIKKSLVVEKGVFDSRMATLVLSDTCHLWVGKEGKVLWQGNQLLVKQATDVPPPRKTPTTWAAIWQVLIGWKRERCILDKPFEYQQFRWLGQETIPPSPPPELGDKAAFIGRA